MKLLPRVQQQGDKEKRVSEEARTSRGLRGRRGPALSTCALRVFPVLRLMPPLTRVSPSCTQAIHT